MGKESASGPFRDGYLSNYRSGFPGSFRIFQEKSNRFFKSEPSEEGGVTFSGLKEGLNSSIFLILHNPLS
jgi:hypothetical protein